MSRPAPPLTPLPQTTRTYTNVEQQHDSYEQKSQEREKLAEELKAQFAARLSPKPKPTHAEPQPHKTTSSNSVVDASAHEITKSKPTKSPEKPKRKRKSVWGHDVPNCTMEDGEPLHPKGTPFEPRRFPARMPFLEALSTCKDLECIHDAHLQPRKGARFNYPQFMVLGWAKSATTSISRYIKEHPDIAPAPVKEPAYYSEDCLYPDCNLKCDSARTLRYVKDELNMDTFVSSGGKLATYDADPQTIAVWFF